MPGISKSGEKKSMVIFIIINSLLFAYICKITRI
jgi:hypothetical protein